MLVALILLGGVAGWIFSLFRHPVYEATAVYQVSLDEQQLVNRGLVAADTLPLQFADQNLYLSPAADLFLRSHCAIQRSDRCPFPKHSSCRGVILILNVFYLDRPRMNNGS